MALTSSTPPPRPVYGLPSNPRDGRLLRQASQPSLVRPALNDPEPPALPTHNQRLPQPSHRRDRPLKNSKSVAFPASFRTSAASSSSQSSSGSSLPSTRKPTTGSPSRSRLEDNDSYTASRTSRTSSALSKVSNTAKVDPTEATHASDIVGTPGANNAPIWRTVANMATNLTVNVTKAWSSTLVDYDGEDTPAGADSRITRALKSYHLSKAHDFADLPDWLFSEKERRADARRQLTQFDGNAGGTAANQQTDLQSERPGNSGNGSYHSSQRAIDTQGQLSTDQSPSPPRGGISGGDRLKALREKRRVAEKAASKAMSSLPSVVGNGPRAHAATASFDLSPAPRRR